MIANEKQSDDQRDFKIPLDMVPDVLGIIVSQQLTHSVTEAGGEKWYIRVSVHYNRNEERQRVAVTQIERLLDTFNDYRSASYEEINWR